MTLRQIGRALAASIAILTAMAGCRAGAPALNLPIGAMVLHTASVSDIPSLDPAVGYDTQSWAYEQMIFETLVRYSDGGVDLIPDVANSWETSPDAKTFIFHLRHDVRFTNGRTVTSADFKYAIERVLAPATRSPGAEHYRAIIGADQVAAGAAKNASGIETPDAYSIIFHLTRPDPIFAQKLAMPFAAAVPREVAEQWGEDFSRHAVGSGPFMLKQWINGQRLVLVKNPHYFVAGLPHLDAIVDQIGVNQELEWLRFEAGEIDLASSIPPAEFPYVMKTPRLRALTLKIVTLATDYLGMNCQMPPFNDVRVRRAFNYAINKTKLTALMNGRGVVARGILPPGLPGFDPNLEGYPYDPTKARRLLEEAGIGKDFRPVLWLRADQIEMQQGQSIQQDLALVGVNVVLKPVAWGPLLEAVRQPRTVEMFSFGWEADFPDPENFLDVLFSRKQWGANNDSFYYNPRVDELLAAAAPLSDSKQRYELYDDAEKMVIADAPWVLLFNPVTYVIRQPWVHGLVLNPMRPARLEKVWLSPHRPQS